MSKRNKIIYWIATIWLSLGMLSTGLAQLFKSEMGAAGADSIARLGYPIYFLTIIGVWKLLGVIALLIPKFVILKEWAYAGMFFLMTGALMSHIIMKSPAIDLFPSLLLLTLTVVSWYFRPENRKMITAN